MAYPYLTDFINDVFGTNIHLPIATFGAFVGLAILLAIQVMRKEVIRLINQNQLHGLNEAQAGNVVSEIAFVATIAGVVGAKLFDTLEQPMKFVNDPVGVIFSTGGFSIYGGLILGALAGMIYVKRKSVTILPMLDAAAPALALGYGIGRLGCQFSGDGDWGKPAVMELKPQWLPEWLWAQTYPNNVLQVDIAAPGVYPTPIYEAAGAFLIFIVLWQLRKKITTAGHLFFCYLILSSIARWMVEEIRINQQYEVLGYYLSQAQIISAGLIMVAIWGWTAVKNSSGKLANN